MDAFRLFPEGASVQAGRTDIVFWLLFWASAAIVLLVVVLLVTFCFRYRRGSKVERGPLPKVLSRELEVGWTTATLFAFLFFF
jgi:cytochrome c oxidase subunit 2